MKKSIRVWLSDNIDLVLVPDSYAAGYYEKETGIHFSDHEVETLKTKLEWEEL